MAIKATDQVDVVDLTDAYNVLLTSESYAFPGSTSAALAGSTTTQVVAMQGATQVAATVTTSEFTVPSGVTVTSDGNATAPTLTITVTTSVTSAGNITIPVHLTGGITINKVFSFAIAFQGAAGGNGKGISGTPTVTYQVSSSGTTTPTGTWVANPPSVPAGQFLWTRTVFTYTDSTTTTAYSVGSAGATGATGAAGKGISGTPTVTYQTGTSGTSVPTGTWSSTVPTVAQGSYLWTKTVTTYTDSTTTTGYSVAYNASDGADALTMSITSSNGNIFKNTVITTVLTAHVYQGGVEVTGSALTALGTISWYENGSSTATATGPTLTINAGDVTNKATYVAQLVS